MKHLITTILCLFALTCLSPLHAEERVWTSSDGKKLKAELISYDLEANQVVIKNKRGKEYTLPLERLSEEDRNFLKELDQEKKEKAAENAKIIAERAGKTFTEKTDAGNTFHVYYPKSYTSEKKPPMLILFSPGGGGKGIMNNFKQGADSLGWVVVGCDKLKNGQNWGEGKTIFNDLLPVIEERVDHDPELLYMGGFSGGGLRALLYSAEYDKPWKGIISCGGWLGGSKNYDKDYRKYMAVAMVNGDTDAGANSYAEADKDILKKRRCKVEIFNFKGGHTIGSPELIEEAMTWVQENTKTEK